MRTQRENYQLFFAALVALVFTSFMSTTVRASVKPITCETNFGEKSFTIEESTIAFHSEPQAGRSISSVLDSVTKTTHNGFKKITYKDGNKHLINIKNRNSFNSNDDYLAITSPKGHKMTYPINCSLLK